MLLIYSIPYIYLFLCFLIVRLKEPLPDPDGSSQLALRRRDRRWEWPAAHTLAMIVASIPPSDTAEPWLFRLRSSAARRCSS